MIVVKLDPLEAGVQCVSFVKLRVADARYYARVYLNRKINNAVGWWLRKLNDNAEDDRY